MAGVRRFLVEHALKRHCVADGPESHPFGCFAALHIELAFRCGGGTTRAEEPPISDPKASKASYFVVLVKSAYKRSYSPLITL